MRLHKQSDSCLWKLVAQGNLGAENELGKRLLPRVIQEVKWAFRGRKLLDCIAKDIAGGAILEVFRYVHQHPIKNPWAYLRQIAKNMALNEINSPSYQRETIESTLNSPLEYRKDIVTGNLEEGEFHQWEIDEAVAALKEAIHHLSPRLRTAFILYYKEGFTIDEIAHQLGCSKASVKVNLFRARRAIRKALELSPPHQDEEDEEDHEETKNI